MRRLNLKVDNLLALWYNLTMEEDGGDIKGARSMEVTMATTITIDVTQGVDLFRGSKLLEHFEGANAYKLAKAAASEKPGSYIRYWGLKPTEEGK